MALNLKLSASMEFVGVARGRPVMDFGDSSSKLAGESYIFWSGRPTWRPYRKRSCLHTTAPFFFCNKKSYTNFSQGVDGCSCNMIYYNYSNCNQSNYY